MVSGVGWAPIGLVGLALMMTYGSRNAVLGMAVGEGVHSSVTGIGRGCKASENIVPSSLEQASGGRQWTHIGTDSSQESVSSLRIVNTYKDMLYIESV